MNQSVNQVIVLKCLTYQICLDLYKTLYCVWKSNWMFLLCINCTAQFHQALQIMDRSTTGTYTQPGARENMAYLQNTEIQQGGSPMADRWSQGVRNRVGNVDILKIVQSYLSYLYFSLTYNYMKPGFPCLMSEAGCRGIVYKPLLGIYHLTEHYHCF